VNKMNGSLQSMLPEKEENKYILLNGHVKRRDNVCGSDILYINFGQDRRIPPLFVCSFWLEDISLFMALQ